MFMRNCALGSSPTIVYPRELVNVASLLNPKASHISRNLHYLIPTARVRCFDDQTIDLYAEMLQIAFSTAGPDWEGLESKKEEFAK
jgi:hypothetical protein